MIEDAAAEVLIRAPPPPDSFILVQIRFLRTESPKLGGRVLLVWPLFFRLRMAFAPRLDCKTSRRMGVIRINSIDIFSYALANRARVLGKESE